MRPVLPALIVAIVLGATVTFADSPNRRADDKVAAINLRTSCRLKDEEDYACRMAVASALDTHRLMVSNHPQLAIYCSRQEPTIEEAKASVPGVALENVWKSLRLTFAMRRSGVRFPSAPPSAGLQHQ
jgi:hypothetical protein